MEYRISRLGFLCALVGCCVAPSGAFLELTANLDKRRNDDRMEMRQMVFTSLVYENREKA